MRLDQLTPNSFPSKLPLVKIHYCKIAPTPSIHFFVLHSHPFRLYGFSSFSFRHQMDKLPDDVLYYIFELLPFINRVQCRQVCYKWQRVNLQSFRKIKQVQVSQCLQCGQAIISLATNIGKEKISVCDMKAYLAFESFIGANCPSAQVTVTYINETFQWD